MDETQEVKSDQRDDERLKSFLLASISDLQSTIRSLDVKANILLAILILPLTKIDSIVDKIKGALGLMDSCSHLVFCFLLTVLFASWMAAIVSTIRVLIAIDNPSHHITGEKPAGIFYSGGLFHSDLRDVFVNRNVSSSKTFEDYANCFSISAKEMNGELIYEIMKLAYIRSLKLERVKAGYGFGAMYAACVFTLGVFVLL